MKKQIAQERRIPTMLPGSCACGRAPRGSKKDIKICYLPRGARITGRCA